MKKIIILIILVAVFSLYGSYQNMNSVREAVGGLLVWLKLQEY